MDNLIYENNHIDDIEKVMKKLSEISDSVLRVDRRVHNQYTKDNLEKVQDDIKNYEARLKKACEYLALSSECASNKSTYDEISKICENINDWKDRDPIKNAGKINQAFGTLLEKYNGLTYSFQTANHEIKAVDYSDPSMNMILLCKNVRTMEDLINKICSNNIDKSIIGGEKHFDSMRHGFVWLFCHNDVNKNPSYQRIDIRDRNRYLDYIKYQIMVASKYVENSPKTSEEIDEYYDSIQYAFDNNDFGTKVDSITNFKNSVTELINIFFQVYELLTKYRDALFREEEIRKNVDSAAQPPEISEEIVRLSAVAVRVLIDRFVSFVKINDLNFGNSTFNRSWFNYSELSNSNYAGSNFKNARIENAKVKNCDISTSNLSLADCSGTDFSDSNFDYSNLTGINLRNATINNCQFNKTLFRDTNLDTYKSAIYDNHQKKLKNIINNHSHTENQQEARRLLSLFNHWGQSEIDDGCIDNIKNAYSKISLEDIAVGEGMSPVNILKCTLPEENTIVENIQNLIEVPLGSHISAELLAYIRKELNNETDKERNARENKDGKILLDTSNLTSVSAKNVQMSEVDFCHIEMSKSSFENADLSTALMFYTNAQYVSFIYGNLNDICCFESNFLSANFTNAVMSNSQFINCNLNSTNWDKAILIGTTFIDASEYMDNIIMNRRINNVSLQLSECFDINTDDATLIQDIIKPDIPAEHKDNEFWQPDCNINGAIFRNALADNAEFINIVSSQSTFNDASLKNTFFANCRMHLSDFIRADFRYAYIVCCSLSRSNFSLSNMTMTKLHYVDFCDANMSNALLNMSELNHVLFDSSNLDGLNLSGATIKNCAFKRCKFENVILSGAVFENCVFEEVEFKELVGTNSFTDENCYLYNCSDKNHNELETLASLKAD